MNYTLIGNVEFVTSRWNGTISCLQFLNGNIGCIFGEFRKISESPIEFGEIVGNIPRYNARYPIPILVYNSDGIIYSSLMLTTDGRLRLYSPDYIKSVALDSTFSINTSFYMAT